MPDVDSTIAREIGQTRPFASVQEEAVVALLRTTDVLRRHLGTVAGTQDLTLQQFNVLRILRGAGDEGLPTLEIGARMLETAPGVTRLVDRLEAKGLVRRQRCPHDRRQVLCFITAEGRARLEALDPAMAAGALDLLRPLSEAQVHDFLNLLGALREGASSIQGESDA